MISDFLIVLFIIVGAWVGFKQGFTRSLVKFLGVIVALILSFLLKNSVSEMLMSFMPFFPFGGLIKGLTVLNIVLYEMIAFGLLFGIFMAILKVISMTSRIFEKILSYTIILGIPSKILGAFVGALKNYIVVFFVVYFLALPQFSEVSVFKNSRLKDPILKNTIVLSGVCSNVLNVLDEFEDLSDKYKSTKSIDEFNLDTLDVFLKYKITSVDTVNSLVKNGKIKIKGIDKVLKKYKK